MEGWVCYLLVHRLACLIMEIKGEMELTGQQVSQMV